MADEQLLVAANAMATTRRWLESFIAAEYSLQGFHSNRDLHNLFCVSCMEGTLNASDFKAGQPHVGHPYLQVRKHTYRGEVVNVDDLAKFIDIASLQSYQANSVFTFSLRARRDVLRMRTPSQWRRFCVNCKDTLSSDSPLVTVCSIECLLRSSPLAVNPAAPTVMEPPKHRYDQAGPSFLHLQNRRAGKALMPGEGETVSKPAEDRELALASEEEKVEMPLQQDLRASSESEEIDGTGARGRAEPDAQTVMEPPKRRYDQPGPSNFRLQIRRTGKSPGEGEGASKSAEDGELEVAAGEQEKAALLLLQDVRASSEAEENIHRTGAQGGVSSALAEMMWKRAREATVHATSEQNPRFNGDDVVRVRRVGSFARFMLSILPPREDRHGVPAQVRDGRFENIHAAQPPDIDAEGNAAEINAAPQPDAAAENATAVINQTSIADFLTRMKHQNES